MKKKGRGKVKVEVEEDWYKKGLEIEARKKKEKEAPKDSKKKKKIKGRVYKVDQKQASVLRKGVEAGMNTLDKLQIYLRKHGKSASRKSISKWREQHKIGKRAVGGLVDFRKRVVDVQKERGCSYKEAFDRVRFAPETFKKRQALIPNTKWGRFKHTRNEYLQRWFKIKYEDIDIDIAFPRDEKGRLEGESYD